MTSMSEEYRQNMLKPAVTSTDENNVETIPTWLSWKNACFLFFALASTICFLPQMLGYSLILDPYDYDNL